MEDTTSPVSESPEQAAAEAELARVEEALRAEGNKQEAQGGAEAPASAENAAQQAPEPQKEVPPKFQRPDGSLDAERLLNSYREMERNFHKSRTKPQTTEAPNFQPPQAPVYAAPTSVDPMRERFVGQLNSDPFGTLAGVADWRAQEAARPLMEKLETLQRELRLSKLAEDPNFLSKAYADEIGNILKEDPSLWNTKDPYGHAFQMAKGRLGGNPGGQVQPKRTPAATLPGGTSQANAPVTTGNPTERILAEAKKVGKNGKDPAAEADYIATQIDKLFGNQKIF